MREREEKKKVSEAVLCPCIQKFTDKPKLTFLSEESVHQFFLPQMEEEKKLKKEEAARKKQEQEVFQVFPSFLFL